MKDVEAVVEGYFATWNETDPARRRKFTEQTWATDATYVDPRYTADGHDGLDELVRAVHDAFPGSRFRLTSAVDAHHDRVRWSWELATPEGLPIATGVDFAVLAEDGRLREVVGFFEPAQA
jgi:hypothetical protein